jgi:uncharacterized protein (DUF302 family)/uncharacterized membrane protein YidH (DUF202 family)
MGFGFVVARFGLFLQQFQIMQGSAAGQGPRAQPYGWSLWFGTALIVAGVIMNVVAAWRHAHLVKRLNEGRPAPVHKATLAIATCVFLALVGIGMAIYLISVRGSGKTAEGDKETMMETKSGASAGAAIAYDAKGMVIAKSKYSVDESVEKLKKALEAKGVTVFAVVDHSGEAAKVGMKMPATKLVIFGSPKGGTPLMLAAPSVAIDLPLKILVAEGAAGAVWISYNSAEYLRERHGFPEALVANIGVVGKFAEAAGSE